MLLTSDILALDVLGAALTETEVPRLVVVAELDGLDAAAAARVLPDETHERALDLDVAAEVAQRGAEGRSGLDGERRGLEVAGMPQQQALRPRIFCVCEAAGLVLTLALGLDLRRAPAARPGAVIEAPAVLGELGRTGHVGGGGSCSGGSKLREFLRRGHIFVAEEVGRGSAWRLLKWMQGLYGRHVLLPVFFCARFLCSCRDASFASI